MTSRLSIGGTDSRTGSGPAPAGRSAIGLLRVLLIASVLVPALLFAAASWVNHEAAVANAVRELRRISQVAREHASKVFDSQSQVADRIGDLVQGMDAHSIEASEAALHEAFAGIVARLPQVQSVLLADRDGRPLVSAGTYPIPPGLSVRNRDYFKAVIGGYPGTYVSSLQTGDVNRQLFFGLARPWIRSGDQVAGVIDLAVSPAFFLDFYKVLVGDAGEPSKGKIVTLIRDDGQILVRFPPFDGPPPRAPPDSPFLAATRADPDEGVFENRSMIDKDRPARLFAYRKVPGYPVYVVAGLSRAVIVAGWRATMESHLVFGIPATLALLAVTWTALIRTRREQDALARAQSEIRRRESAEEALLRSQRLEAVGQLTGGVAHDFNNLLTVILGSAEMLGRRAGDPTRVRRIADQIALAARRGGDITQQLLAFSRRQLVQPETIDLNRRLQEFRPLLDRAASEAVRVDLDLEPGLEPVRLDPGHFEAAILNLVGNARDAMPAGGRVVIKTRSLTVTRSEPELRPGRYIVVALADTGVGMDPDTAAKAFEPFFTTKDVGKGTGLGLSQVYGFAKQAGGDVRIVTAPGEGTTIELLLPTTTEQVAVERTDVEPAPREPGADGEVVLVVEDEPGVLGAAVESLHDLGYVTLTASNAEAALVQLRTAGRVDVLFSDVVMPGGMNGVQLSVEARRLKPDLKVLLTSGYTAGIDRPHPSDIRLLTKPYDRTELATQLRAALQD